MAGMSALKSLPANTIRLIGSTQVITSVFSAIKELIENSLDAGSTVIDVKLENYGLDKIEIRDNGSGIKVEDVDFVGRSHYTSKISSHSDLERLNTYGFRGEALASLCAVSEVTLTTKTATDDVGMTYSLTNKGEISNKKPSHLGQGTTITAAHLFKNLPVRKQYHNTVKKKKEELKRIEDLLVAFGVIRPDVRVSLRHNKELLWQKNVLPDTRAVLLSVLGRNTFSNLEKRVCHLDDPEIDVEMYIPKPGSDINLMSRTSTDRCFMAVNSRPVDVKEIHKLLRRYYCTCHNIEGTRQPIYCMSIRIPPSDVDVNLDPNKTRVLLQHMDAVKKCVETELLYMYGPLDNQPSWKYKEADKEEIIDKIDFAAKEKVEKYITNNKQKEDIVDLGDVDRNDQNKKSDSRSSDNNFNKDNEEDWNNSDEDSELLQADVSTPTLPERTNSVVSGNNGEQTIQQVEMLIKENLIKDADNSMGDDSLNEKLSNSIAQKQNSEGTKRSPNNDNRSNNASTASISNLNPTIKEISPKMATTADESDLETTCNASCSQEVIDLGVGRFDISDDLLDDSFSSSQSKNVSQEGSENLTSAKGQSDISSRSPEPESWSRGVGLTSDSGRSVQPVTLLAPTSGKRSSSPTLNTSLRSLAPPEKKRAVEKPLLQGQTTLYDLVESQAVRQESAFDIFVKEKKKQVVEDNPDGDDEEVTAILEDLWTNMAERDKQKYREARLSTYRKDFKQKELTMKVKKKIDKGRTSVRDHLVSTSKKSVSSHSMKSSKEVKFSLDDLKPKYTKEFRDSQSQYSRPANYNLIGQLKSCGSWVCSYGNKILLTNPHRLAETILYHQLLSQHRVTSKPLPKPVPLTPSTVGDEGLLTTLEKLVKWSNDPYSYVEDPRIMYNGFNIRCHKDNEGRFCAELMGQAGEIAMFGVADLSETLDLIAHTSADTIKKSRPLKVINYLKSEAVRMVRQAGAERSTEDVQELLVDISRVLPDGCDTCLHNKPFFHQVYDLCDLPVNTEESIMESQLSQV